MTKRDYYEILGIGRESGDQEIKQAYRKLALKFHPDRNPDDPSAEDNFKEASEAYSVLSDGQKRAAYDRFGHAGLQGGGTAADSTPKHLATSATFWAISSDSATYSAAGSAARGRNAAKICATTWRSHLRKPCSACRPRSKCRAWKRAGAAKVREQRRARAQRTCPTCHGRGEVIYQQSFLSIRRTCSTCNGTGQVIRNPCSECRGQAFRQAQRKLKINIPAGVDTGTRVRLSGEGQPGFHGGPPGDLYVFLKVKEHPFFERQENDLHCTIPLNVAQAALGCEIEVPTLGEPSNLKIPEGTQNGAKFRFRNKGVAVVNSSSRGDLYVHVEVKIPSKLSREQRKLLEQLRDTLPVDNSPADKGLFEKVKDYFM